MQAKLSLSREDQDRFWREDLEKEKDRKHQINENDLMSIGERWRISGLLQSYL